MQINETLKSTDELEKKRKKTVEEWKAYTLTADADRREIWQGRSSSSGGARGATKEEEKTGFTVPEMIRRYKEDKDKSYEGLSSSAIKPRFNMIRFCQKD